MSCDRLCIDNILCIIALTDSQTNNCMCMECLWKQSSSWTNSFYFTLLVMLSKFKALSLKQKTGSSYAFVLLLRSSTDATWLPLLAGQGSALLSPDQWPHLPLVAHTHAQIHALCVFFWCIRKIQLNTDLVLQRHLYRCLYIIASSSTPLAEWLKSPAMIII